MSAKQGMPIKARWGLLEKWGLDQFLFFSTAQSNMQPGREEPMMAPHRSVAAEDDDNSSHIPSQPTIHNPVWASRVVPYCMIIAKAGLLTVQPLMPKHPELFFWCPTSAKWELWAIDKPCFQRVVSFLNTWQINSHLRCFRWWQGRGIICLLSSALRQPGMRRRNSLRGGSRPSSAGHSRSSVLGDPTNLVAARSNTNSNAQNRIERIFVKYFAASRHEHPRNETRLKIRWSPSE